VTQNVAFARSCRTHDGRIRIAPRGKAAIPVGNNRGVRLIFAFAICGLVLISGPALAQSGSGQTPKPGVAKPTPSPEQAKLKQAETGYQAARRRHVAQPKDKKVTQTYVRATVTYGNVVMFSPALPPKAKYPKALALYREALQLDPTNKTALNNKKVIEDIYRSMNRPIPKG